MSNTGCVPGKYPGRWPISARRKRGEEDRRRRKRSSRFRRVSLHGFNYHLVGGTFCPLASPRAYLLILERGAVSRQGANYILIVTRDSLAA